MRQTDQFRMEGYSGFVLASDDGGTVVKSANGLAAERLERQCIKQMEFRLTSRRFRVCPVIERERSPGRFSFRMPFCAGATAVEFIDRASPEAVRDLARALSELLSEFIKASHPGSLPRERILRKSTSRLLKNPGDRAVF